jgi:hypothetical protein
LRKRTEGSGSGWRFRRELTVSNLFEESEKAVHDALRAAGWNRVKFPSGWHWQREVRGGVETKPERALVEEYMNRKEGEHS